MSQKLRLRARHYRFLATGSFPYPKAVCIDPVNICQLKCPLCPAGARRLGYGRGMMSLDTFKAVIDRLPFVRNVDLFNWGEPFLNPDLLGMIRYAHDRGIRTKVSTNFSIKKDDGLFEGLIRSGLETLLVSLDGASRESYSRYRVGGDFDLVISNIEKTVSIRNKLGGRGPEVIWQFIVNKYNEYEIDAARKMADDLGVKLELIPMGLADDLPDAVFEGGIEERKSQWLPADSKYVHSYYMGEYRPPLSPFACEQLFSYMVVNPDGRVSPCCFSTDEDNVFGDLLSEPFREIWNNERYVLSRLLFLKKGHAPKVGTVCYNCNNFFK